MGLVAAGMQGLLPLPVQAQETPPVPPGVIFLVDNNESMQDYPQYLPEAFTPGFYPTPVNPRPGDLGGEGSAGLALNTGCSDPALVSAMSWFDKDSTELQRNGAIPFDSDSDLYSPFFEPNKFYFSRGRRLGWNVKEMPFAVNGNDFAGPLFTMGDPLTACYASVGWDLTDYPYTGSVSGNAPLMNECVACLTSKGWWRGPIVTSRTQAQNPGQAGPVQELGEPPLPPEAFRKWVLSGRVLNVRPPRFVNARKVLKDVIQMVTNTRMGVATFGGNQGWFDPPELLAKLRPACDQSSPVFNDTALDRPGLRRAVNAVRFRNPERSLGEALFGLGGYFSSQVVDNRWGSWFPQPISPGWGWPGCCNGGTFDNPYTGEQGMYWGVASDEWLKPGFTDPWSGAYFPGQPWEGTGADKSVCNASQVNAVIAVTSGTPRSDNTVPITRMMDLLKANGARHPDGVLLTFDPANPDTNPNVGGVNYCDRFVKSDGYPWAEYFTKADCDYTDFNWPTGLAVGNKNFMDDVAFFLANTDLRGDLVGAQPVRTYVIGYGDSSPMLQSIAMAGQGRFYRANGIAELRAALLDAIGASHPPAGSTP
ncbi:hypothetical protein NR798_31565 [Archangium gephyra]|uniref:hypothetical protein n=1 Tax=Archangium gephyra TaxID=48 RepID=UPI0035D49385